MGVRDFGELRVYRLAFGSAMELFAASAAWPREERYALTGQVRRSSRAICGCLAEAWSKRRYPAHFTSKLTDALGEARETLVWLDFARACGYLSEQQHAEARTAYDNIAGMLTRMIEKAHRWHRPDPDSPPAP